MKEQVSNKVSTDLYESVLSLLKEMIATPSYSSNEDGTADLIQDFMESFGVKTHRKMNNIWAYNQFYDSSKPTILLNSHHDTVRPNDGYTMNPFVPLEKEGKLYGLGSNDAGGALISLIATFLHFWEKPDLKYNLILAATAEEEISGLNGIESIFNRLGKVDFAIIGEPTEMNLAVAEKGLIVLDCTAKGTSSHVAHPNIDNAILNAIKDIEWFNSYTFEKTSPLLGEVKMTTTLINSGSQHNVVPDSCKFTVDVRTTEQYTNAEVLAIVQENVKSEVTPRSLRLNSSSIPLTHPFVQAGLQVGRTYYGSPTLSDQALIPCPSIKMGPGLSTRSHSSDEFIYVKEIKEALEIYKNVLNQIL